MIKLFTFPFRAIWWLVITILTHALLLVFTIIVQFQIPKKFWFWTLVFGSFGWSHIHSIITRSGHTLHFIGACVVLAYLCVLIFGYEWEKQIEKSDKDLSEQTNLQVAFTIFDYAYTDKIPYEPKPSTLRWLFYSNIAIALAVLTIVS